MGCFGSKEAKTDAPAKKNQLQQLQHQLQHQVVLQPLK